MGSGEKKNCTLCGALFDKPYSSSPFVQAGEWLAEDVWKDSGTLCSMCLESRGRLAMMYLHDRNR
jgi:hypothetical protein